MKCRRSDRVSRRLPAFVVLASLSLTLFSCHPEGFNESREAIQRILDDARNNDSQAASREFDPSSPWVKDLGKEYARYLCAYMQNNYGASFIILNDFPLSDLDGLSWYGIRIANDRGGDAIEFTFELDRGRWLVRDYELRAISDVNLAPDPAQLPLETKQFP